MINFNYFGFDINYNHSKTLFMSETSMKLPGTSNYFFKSAPGDGCRFKREDGEEVYGIVEKITVTTDKTVYTINVTGTMYDVADGSIVLPEGD